MFDYDPMTVGALEDSDTRRHEIMVAGPAALLVAKAHKVRDRVVENRRDRIADKDALDIVRLLRGCEETDVAERIKRLQSLRGSAVETERSTAAVGDAAMEFIRTEFGVPAGRGCDMAARAAVGAMGDEELRASTVDLVQRLLRRVAPSA